MVPGPQAWEEAGSARRCGAARRGETNVVGRNEARPGEERRREAKRGEERRGEAKSMRTYMYARCVRTYRFYSVLCRHVDVCMCSVLACRCPCPLFVCERARQSRSTRAKGIDGAVAKLPDHYSIGATSSETLLYDQRRYRSRPRAHVQFRARTRAIAEKERQREREIKREREREYVRDKPTARVKASSNDVCEIRPDDVLWASGWKSERRDSYRRDVNKVPNTPM